MRRLIVLAVATGLCAKAGVIGQWEGSGVDAYGNLLTWNSPLSGMTYSLEKVRTIVEAAGYTVGPDAALTAANLATYDSLVIRLPRLTPDAGEMAALSAWVHGGGLLLAFLDMNMLGGSDPFNNIMAGIGSSLHITSSSVTQNFALSSGLFLSDGPPYDIAGYYLSPTPGRWLYGGTALSHGSSSWTPAQQQQAEAIVRYEQIGLGYVIAFADSLDVDYFSPSANNVVGRMLLNAAAYQNPGLNQQPDPGEDPPPAGEVPEPPSWMLSLPAAGLACAARKRR